MVNWTLMRKVRRDLLTRKASLAALVVIMMFGIGSLVGMLSVYRDLEAARVSYFHEERMADFFVSLKRAPAWSVTEAERLPNVSEVYGRVNLRVVIDLPDVDEPVSGTAISLPYPRRPVMNDVRLVSGTWFSGMGEREVLVNEAFARANGFVPGHRIKVMLLDEQHDLLIVGIVVSPEFIYQIPPGGGLAPDPKRFGSIYLEETFLQEAGDLNGAYNEFLGNLHDSSPRALRVTMEQIKEELEQYGALNANSTNEQISTKFLLNELEGISKSSFITPVIFLFVAALVLNVLIARLVQQQRIVIGTLKAIGYSSWQISFHYLGYGLLIGLAGGTAGSILAAWMHGTLLKLYRAIFEFPTIEFHFHYDLYAIGFLFSIGAACLGTLKGVRNAARLQPAEAMHAPPPEKTHRTPLEYFPPLWSRLSFRWKMIFRSILRNPFRSLVSVVTAIIASMLILAAFAMRDGMTRLARYEYVEMSRQDYTVTLRNPRGLGFDAEQRLEVGFTEPQLIVPADLSNGVHFRTVSITGIGDDNQLYTPLDEHGQSIPIPRAGLVLSTKLAEILQVGVGDEILVRPLLGERRQTSAPVVALVDTYIGLSAYAHLEYLSRFLGEEWAANVMLTKTIAGGEDAAFARRLKDVREVIGVSHRLSLLRQFEETFNKANAIIISIFIVFAMIIGFGGVLNSSLVSLSERQREVGTLRVLGFTSNQIALIFAGESVVLYGIGSIIGLYVGIYYIYFLAAAYSTELFRFPIVISSWRMWLTLVLMALCIFTAQLIVYKLVDKLDWLEVLKVKE